MDIPAKLLIPMIMECFVSIIYNLADTYFVDMLFPLYGLTYIQLVAGFVLALIAAIVMICLKGLETFGREKIEKN